MKLQAIALISILTFISAGNLFAKQSPESDSVAIRSLRAASVSETDQDSSKGRIFIHLSLPYLNSFHFNPVGEGVKNNAGFIGFLIGADYFYKANRYVHLSFSQVQDFFFPIVFVPRGDEYESMTANVLSLTNNHRLKRFSVGYGLMFSRNRWEVRNISWDKNSSSRKPVAKDNNAVGLSLSGYYQLTRHFHLGFIYRPALIRLNHAPAFNYEHAISVDAAWKIRLGD